VKTRLVVLLLAFSLLDFVIAFHGQARQIPDVDESGVPEVEKRIPQNHYCQNHPPRPQDTRAHECHCGYTCNPIVDQDGNVIDYETKEMPECKAYCRVHGRACSCHPEEPCPKPA